MVLFWAQFLVAYNIRFFSYLINFYVNDQQTHCRLRSSDRL
jgi:hypothetical protein